MTNHPNRSKKEITIEIITETNGMIATAPIGGIYTSRERAMNAAKKFAGKGAYYCGDALSVRYAGAAGTVYICEPN